MGSGHFLITAIDWLTVRLAALVNREWDEAPGYVSPLRARLWELQEQHPALADHTLLERMVLKRCIYGVDKNPMAVELAKVALWLHTFTGELPLPYLDHRIIAGDSLLGIRGEDSRRYLSEWGRYPLGDSFERNCAEAAVAARAADEVLDLTISQIDESRTHRDDARLRNRRHRTPLNLVAGLRWLSAGMKKRERAEFHAPLLEILSGHSGRAIAVLFNGENEEGLTPTTPAYREIRDRANEIAARERILHWEIEFPHVMTGDNPGFDAIISNPPWDRIKLQEVEWWAARDEAVAKARTAADRKRIVARRRAENDPIVAEFDAAAAQAAQLSTLIRKGGDYPLLGKGDINLYSLFVERSLFAGQAQRHRRPPHALRHLRRPHRRRLLPLHLHHRPPRRHLRLRKPPLIKRRSAYREVVRRCPPAVQVLRSDRRRRAKRQFVDARCGFYLHGQADLEDDDRVFPLAPEDFARINPNTGTAPILRTRRDAQIVSRIYRNHPVLVDRSDGEERKLWPVRYHRMFDMANDSELFETAKRWRARRLPRRAQPLQARRRPMGCRLPGRMVHHYDHRFATPSDITRRACTIRTYGDPTDFRDNANPSWTQALQYWVPTKSIAETCPEHMLAGIPRHRTARPTSAVHDRNDRAQSRVREHSVFLLLPESGARARDGMRCRKLQQYRTRLRAKAEDPGRKSDWYIVEQLPMIAPDDFDRPFGDTTARELVKDHVLRLCYTAWDLQPFARDLGYEGDPFIWNPAERRQLRARLDALFFHLYGLDEDDTAYILDQFPVLEKNERREHDRYLTKELVLGHYRALAAGDTTSDIAV